MPVDPMAQLADALMNAARQGSLATARDWNMPTVTDRTRLGPENSLAGYEVANLQTVEFGVGYDSGTGTSFMPFTANISFIEATGLSDDIVTGS